MRAKRFFDFVVSIILLLMLSPVIGLISIVIKILMPGPIFFTQIRIGYSGKEFKLLKLRTMTLEPKAFKGIFEPGNKSRITCFGKILRKTKIDELPQLLNVLKGDMSLVGPRPEVKIWTETYPEKWAIVHLVKPGLTDNASIEFHNEEEILSHSREPEEIYRNIILPRKLDLYIDYVKNHTFGGDINIILQTIKAIILK
jgi:lipopolysaccharide/colanic/teichoic acid biosynthesis glycosyltransferase